MCQFFKVSKAGYYKHLKSDKRKDNYAYELIKQVQDKFKYRYGYRRVQIALEKKYKVHFNHKKVLRIMSKYGLLSKIRRKYMYIRPNEVAHQYANLFSQDFKTTRINEKWTTDISYIITPEGRLYLSVIRDIHDGYVVAYKYSTVQDLRLVAETVKLALKNATVKGTILHSDQGFQYTSHMYYNLTTEYGIIPSMSRKATPLDNAPAESFFSAFKTECIYLEKPKTIQEAKQLCDEYIDFYNFERIQLRYKMTPSEVRQKEILSAG
jgi:transposase InsO family protein